MDYYDKVTAAADAIRRRVADIPPIAIVLGSGLGDFSDRLVHATSIAYAEMPHWPPVTVPGHEGRLVVGTLRDCPVVVLSGRCHAYEGHDLRTVTFPTRVLGVLGVRTLLLTNAAGGINVGLSAGALMVIDDHINLMGQNPLAGPNDERFGPRFPDMSAVYPAGLRRLADEAAAERQLAIRHGVYAAVLGPSYETPAEIRALRAMGADAVGMSTVPEAIVARHMGMEVLGISCITNLAAGVSAQPLSHEEVMATAHRVRGDLSALVEGVIGRFQQRSQSP